MSLVQDTRENISVVSSTTNGGVTLEVLEYQKLLGSTDLNMASMLWFMEQQNLKVRQIVATIDNSSVTIEAGAMSYFQGNLEMVSGVTLGNLVGKVFKGALTGENVSQPIYKGKGTLVLEPSFKHFLPITLDAGETVIVDKGMFYVSTGGVKVEPFFQKSISSGLLGGEGWFQLSITGPGVVMLESPVPFCEINRIDLNNDTLRVDGNFALLRTKNIDFTVERSAKTLVGSAVSGEGLVNVFRGTGQVWVAPTLKVYNMLSSGVTSINKMNMNTSKG